MKWVDRLLIGQKAQDIKNLSYPLSAKP